MGNRLKILTSLFLLLLLLGQCKETYVSPYRSPNTGYLVVEGFIAAGPTKFILSRVAPLQLDSVIPRETRAQLQVEGNDNSIYPLTETSAGVYTVDTLPLNPAAKYRLRIRTSNGAAYLSDFVPYRISPPIDSINWIQDLSGVNIYVNSHDPADTTRYYRWDFDETWQYHMGTFSYYRFQPRNDTIRFDTVVLRADSEYVYNCWSNASSISLLLGSSVRLSKDVIYRQPLQFIPDPSQRLDYLYTILVRQYALTEAAYNYLSLMKANSESLGSIFDAQPSELKGNIQLLGDPYQPVLGYISAGTVRERRIYIRRDQLVSWGYNVACRDPNDTIYYNQVDDWFKYNQLTPIERVYIGFGGWALTANDPECIDCRTLGGSNKRPAFWPNN